VSPFWKGLLIAGAAPVIMSFVPWAGAFTSDTGTQVSLLLTWFLAPVAFVVTLIISLSSRTFRTTSGRAGVLTGLGLAIVAMGTSCFVMWNG